MLISMANATPALNWSKTQNWENLAFSVNTGMGSVQNRIHSGRKLATNSNTHMQNEVNTYMWIYFYVRKSNPYPWDRLITVKVTAPWHGALQLYICKNI